MGNCAHAQGNGCVLVLWKAMQVTVTLLSPPWSLLGTASSIRVEPASSESVRSGSRP
jgi:hypothetical protein